MFVLLLSAFPRGLVVTRMYSFSHSPMTMRTRGKADLAIGMDEKGDGDSTSVSEMSGDDQKSITDARSEVSRFRR